MASPDFIPKLRLITSITNASSAVVTTSTAHEYNSGDVIMLVVPKEYGMRFDYKEYEITVTGNTTFTIPVNTLNIDIFVVPAAPFTTAHCCNVTGITENNAT